MARTRRCRRRRGSVRKGPKFAKRTRRNTRRRRAFSNTNRIALRRAANLGRAAQLSNVDYNIVTPYPGPSNEIPGPSVSIPVIFNSVWNIAQGTGDTEKTGRFVYLTLWRLRFSLRNTSTGERQVRMIIGYDKRPNTGAPDGDWLLTAPANGTTGFRNLEVAYRFHIIQDRTIRLTSTGQAYPVAEINKNIPVRRRIHYTPDFGNGTTAANIPDNMKPFVWLMANGNGVEMSNGHSRIRYYDLN